MGCRVRNECGRIGNSCLVLVPVLTFRGATGFRPSVRKGVNMAVFLLLAAACAKSVFSEVNLATSLRTFLELSLFNLQPQLTTDGYIIEVVHS